MSAVIDDIWIMVTSFWWQYWPVISLLFIVLITIQKHGIKGIFYQITKQIICVSFICIIAICGYVILLKQWREIDKSLSFTLAKDLFYGNYSKLLNDGNLMIPLSNFLFSAGFIIFILGLLYQILPIDLIPDVIPLIGLYDNLLASIISYSGLIVCIIGIIFSMRYYEKKIENKESVQMNFITKSVYSAFQFVYDAANNTFG